MPSLVYLSYSYPPLSSGATPRNLLLPRFLGELGWRFTVVTASNPRGLPLDPGLEALLPADTEVRRAYHLDPTSLGRGWTRSGDRPRRATAAPPLEGGPRRRLRGWVSIPDRVITWAPTLLPLLQRTVRRTRADVLVSAGPPHSVHLMAAACSRICSVPLVPYFGDLWVRDSNVEYGSEALRRLHRKLEGRVVRASSGIVTTAPGASRSFLDAYGAGCPPVHTVINGYDPDRPVPSAPTAPDGPFRIVHTGNFVGANTPGSLPLGLELFLERHSGPPIEIRFFGRMENGYERSFRTGRLGAVVRIAETTSRERAAAEQVGASLLLVCLADRPGAELKIPAKLAEYAKSGVPVLAIGPPGDMTGLVEELRLGYTAPPEPHAIARALEQAYEDFTDHTTRPEPDRDGIRRTFDMRESCRGLDRFLREEVLRA